MALDLLKNEEACARREGKIILVSMSQQSIKKSSLPFSSTLHTIWKLNLDEVKVASLGGEQRLLLRQIIPGFPQ